MVLLAGMRVGDAGALEFYKDDTRFTKVQGTLIHYTGTKGGIK